MLSTTRFVPTQKIIDANATSQLIALWLHGKALNTVRNYQTTIYKLIGYLSQQPVEAVRLNDLDLRTLTLNDIQGFIDYLLEKGDKPSSINTRIDAIKSLYSFGCKCGYLTINTPVLIKKLKDRDDLAERILSEFEVMRLIEATPPGRDRLVVEFLYYTGARVSEVAGLTWNNIKPNRDGGQVTLFGKGGKTRTVLLTNDIYTSLLKTRTDSRPSAAVFPSRKGSQPLQVRQLRKIVKDAGSKAGISGDVSPHWLRHSHASHSLDRGAPPQLVKQTLGHESLETLTRYAHARPSDSSGLYLPK